MSNSSQVVVALYKKLVGFYPDEYRQQYGQEMVLTFEDVVEETGATQGSVGVWVIFLHSCLDTLVQSVKEHLNKRKNGGGYMAEYKTLSPVRGFKTFFWTMTGIAILISFLPERYPVTITMMGMAILFLVLLIPLLVRAKKGWPLALGIVGFVLFAGVLFSQIVQNNLGQLPLRISQYFNGSDPTLLPSNRLMEVYSNLIFILPFLLLGYLAVRETERPQLGFLWKKVQAFMKQADNEARTKLWQFFTSIVLISAVAVCVMALFIGSPWGAGVLKVLSLSELVNYFSFFYVTLAGHVSLLLIFLVVCFTALTGWVLSSKKLLPTIGVSLLATGIFIGSGLLVSAQVLPRNINTALSAEQGLAMAESCAVRNAGEFGQSVESSRSAMYLQGPAPTGITGALCSQLTSPRQEGDIYYQGGYGSSVDQKTGQAVNFVLQGAKLPYVAQRVTDPALLLLLAVAIQYLVPACAVIALMWGVKKLGDQSKSNK